MHRKICREVTDRQHEAAIKESFFCISFDLPYLIFSQVEFAIE